MEMQKTRHGSASFVMVIFFTILIGIITVGFISIMLSNVMQSTDYDLSQSAMDSALAGVEDAKIMLLKYNSCKGKASASEDGTACNRIVKLVDGANSEQDCNLVGKALGRIPEDADDAIETKVQLSYGDVSNNKNAQSDNLDQAYTCVRVTPITLDFLGQLTPTDDYKIIPLKTKFNASQTTESPVASIELQWFNESDIEAAKNSHVNPDNNIIFNPKPKNPNVFGGKNGKDFGSGDDNTLRREPSYAPLIQLGLVQTPASSFSLSSFDKSSGNNSNRGLIYLRPRETNNAELLKIGVNKGFAASARTNVKEGGVNQQAADTVNSPYVVNCSSKDVVEGNQAYACKVRIDLPKAIGPSGAAMAASDLARFITLSSPYGMQVSYSIKLFDASDNSVEFAGVQSIIDSTGRANDLFRRVESRVELTDVNYPFPKFALAAYCEDEKNCDADEGKIVKDYWVSKNCYTIIGGEVKECGSPVQSGNKDFMHANTSGF